jgi:uncharacterized protein (TIGR00251 family)
MVLQVNVKPGSRVELLDRDLAGRWIARVLAPAAEGRANEALIALLAKHFEVAKRQVRIRTGHVSRIKLVEIEGVFPDQLRLFDAEA